MDVQDFRQRRDLSQAIQAGRLAVVVLTATKLVIVLQEVLCHADSSPTCFYLFG